jgi:hypothetical protein
VKTGVKYVSEPEILGAVALHFAPSKDAFTAQYGLNILWLTQSQAVDVREAWLMHQPNRFELAVKYSRRKRSASPIPDLSVFFTGEECVRKHGLDV